MELKVKEVKVAYVVGALPVEIHKAMTELNASMYDDNGGGQYSLDSLMAWFDADDEEYEALNTLLKQGYDYLEWS